MYETLLKLRVDLKQLKNDQTLPVEMIEQRFIYAMQDKMVLNYQEILFKYTEISEDLIANFDQNTILAFLTSIIRMERFMEGTLAHNLRSGSVLMALEKLAVLVNIEHQIMLSDNLKIKEKQSVKKYAHMASTLQNLSLSSDSTLKDLEPLRIAKNGDVEVYYSPFDYVNISAKIVLVGITPGKTQLLNALLSINRCFQQGYTPEEALKIAKKEGAFSGKLRENLVKLLDCIGINKKLNIISASSLFDEDSHLIHTTSILRQPVFVKGKDYSGSTPDMLKHPLMQEQIELYLKEEIRQLPNAIYIPLGNKVAKVFEALVKEGLLNEKQVLAGLPHPSGANSGRIAYFLGNKSKDSILPSSTTKPEILDSAKQEILKKLATLTI